MSARRATALGVLCALALALVVLVYTQRWAGTQEVWFEDIRGPLAITGLDAEVLVRFIAMSILREKVVEDSLPTHLREDGLPRIIFLSLSDGDAPARVVLGSGIGVSNAIERAVSGAHILLETGYQLKWVKVDIVQDIVALDNVDLDQPLGLDRSLYGLAFDRQCGVAFLPEELVAYTLVDSDQIVRPDNIITYLEREPAHAEDYQRSLDSNRINLFRFTTTSFFFDSDEIVPLYRGHRLFNRSSREDLLSAARWGGQYLTQAVGPDGKFAYIYWPTTARVSEQYNILRHAGTVYAMMELYEFTGSVELLEAAQRAIGYLLQSVELCSTREETLACIVEDGYVKLGGNALAAIALAKYTEVTDDRQYVPILLDLGRWIQSAQGENGEFIHKESYPEGEAANFVSAYYPGEALLAMTRIYALDPDETWLDTAEAGAQYLINVRDGGLSDSELPHDHWLLYALNELYRYRPTPLYLNHALRTASAILQSQNRNPIYPDWLGSFHRPPRSTPAATRMEGLCAAYLLARDFGHPREAEAIMEGMWLGAAFQQQTQFWPESVMYLDDPKRPLGGFHRSLTDFEIRIDYVQHNISSLLCLYRITGDQIQNAP